MSEGKGHERDRIKNATDNLIRERMGSFTWTLESHIVSMPNNQWVIFRTYSREHQTVLLFVNALWNVLPTFQKDCKDPAWRTHSILCMPIKHSDGRVLGVCQFVNKSSQPPTTTDSLHSSFSDSDAWSGAFSRNDESLFEAFALFAGLGIANTQMYEQVLKAEAKQRIAFDVLSYHATATPAEASALAKELIPSAKYYRLNQFGFTDF